VTVKITNKTYTVPEIAVYGMKIVVTAQMLDDAAQVMRAGNEMPLQDVARTFEELAMILDEVTEIFKSVVSDNIVK
jgi:hypothetical protein